MFKAIGEIIETELVEGPHQAVTALIALFLGGFLVVKGKKLWDGLIIVAVGYVLGVIAMGSVGDMWHLEHGSSLRKFVGWEVGLIAAWGAYKGLDGMNVFAGVLLGFWFTVNIQHVLVHLGAHFLSTSEGQQWAVVVLYTVFAGGFIWLFSGEAHNKLLALICPLIGGALVASAIAYLFTALVQIGAISKQLEKSCPELQPNMGPYIKFLEMLSSPTTEDFGIFANSPANKFGEKWTVDRLAGWVIWFIFFLVGVKLQWKKKPKAAEASGREQGLQQPFLEQTVE